MGNQLKMLVRPMTCGSIDMSIYFYDVYCLTNFTYRSFDDFQSNRRQIESQIGPKKLKYKKNK